MRGKVPRDETKPSRDYVHVDVCESWLDVHVSPSGAHHRFDNNTRGIARLISLCRELGVSKINMKTTDEHGARAHHALTVAGLSVTASNPLRARMFADARRAGQSWRAAALALTGMAIALSLAGLAAWRWERQGRTPASTTETTKEPGFDTTQKFMDAPGALASYLKDVLGPLLASNHSDKGEERDTSVAHEKIGGVRLSEGDRAAALRSSREGFDIFKALSTADPGDKSRRRGLSASDDSPDIPLAQADPAAALQARRDSLAVTKALSAADPGDIGRRRDLAVAHQKLGDVEATHGDPAAALQSYLRGFDIIKALSAANPGDIGRRRDLAVAYEKIGDAQLARGEPATASRSYRDSFAIVEALSAADPGDIGRRRDLAIAYEKLGDVQAAQGDPAAALQSYRRGFDIIKALSAADPGDIGRRRDLAVVYEKLGDVPLVQGDLTAAARSYRDSLAVTKALSVADPGDDGARRDMIAIYVKLSVAEPSNTRDYLSNAQAIIKALEDKGRLTSSDRAWAAEIDKRFKALGAVVSPGMPSR